MNNIKSHKIAEFQLFSRKHMFRKRQIGGWGEGSLGSVNSFLFKVFCVFYLWLYFFYNQLEMIVNILSNVRYRPSTELITERNDQGCLIYVLLVTYKTLVFCDWWLAKLLGCSFFSWNDLSFHLLVFCVAVLDHSVVFYKSLCH